jgi:hypothetical protein
MPHIGANPAAPAYASPLLSTACQAVAKPDAQPLHLRRACVPHSPSDAIAPCPVPPWDSALPEGGSPSVRNAADHAIALRLRSPTINGRSGSGPTADRSPPRPRIRCTSFTRCHKPIAPHPAFRDWINSMPARAAATAAGTGAVEKIKVRERLTRNSTRIADPATTPRPPPPPCPAFPTALPPVSPNPYSSTNPAPQPPV